MKLSDILTPGLIFNNIKSNQKSLCLNEIIKNICSFDKSLNYELTQKLVFEREQLCSTALDNYIAIPHAKIPGLTKSYCTLAICKNGINFGSVDGQKTKIIIMLLHPESDTKNHLLVLKNIANLFSIKELISKVIDSNDSFDIFNIIKNYENKQI